MPRTKDDLRTEARRLKTSIDAADATIAKLEPEAKEMMATAIKEQTIGTKDFNDKYEEATKPLDAARETRDELRRGYDLVMAELGEAPSGLQAFSAVPQAGATIDDSGWGDRFVNSDVYRAMEASGALNSESQRLGSTPGVEMTAGWREVRNLLTTAAYPLVPQREPGVQRMALETITILDMISIGETTTEIVEWVRQKTRTNAADAVAQGAAAPESTYEWEVVQKQCREIAHYHAATKRALKDEGQLRGLIDDELVDGLRAVLQARIIAGSGVGEQLLGILNETILAQAKAADTWADAVHKGMTKIRVASKGRVEPTALGIHPLDWEVHALEKDGQGNYKFGGPNGNGPTSIWGLKPVVHVAFPQGNPVVGDYKKGKLWIHTNVAVSFSDSHEDFFIKRLVAALAAFQGVFGVLDTNAFCEITG